jgi:hypothetical protein
MVVVAICHTNFQLSSQFTARLLAALLMMLSACGLPASSFAAFGTSPAIVWACRRKRRTPHRVPERRWSAIFPRTIRLANSRPDPWPHATLFYRWLFQRPPSFALLSPA